MNRLKITNLKEILDPHARHLFFDDQGLTEALQIVEVDENSVVLQGKSPGKKREGYFIASNGRGIVRFKGELEPISDAVCRLKLNLSKLKLINRREFNRYEFGIPVPISLKCDEKFVKASLINVGEGGLRMSVGRRLPTQVTYQFEVSLPKGGETFSFKTDGLIVYCEPEEAPDRFMAGVTFIAPKFSSEEERKSYQKSRRDLARFLSQ